MSTRSLINNHEHKYVSFSIIIIEQKKKFWKKITLGHLRCKSSPKNERVRKTAVQIRHHRHELTMQR